PYVGVDLPRMRRESAVARNGRPLLFTNCNTGEGVDAVVEAISRAVLFARP
ncbi:urease accessory protein UreG, partial [Pseudomonas syringae pv. tagetis]